MKVFPPLVLDDDAATAWMAYQALVQRMTVNRQLTEPLGERLCSALGQARWYKGYQVECARLN
ncbi:hypothetical protein [Deinococcus sp. Leaf326]|uniref:hypothetical protein n=1 Tax=Deinococcus sp. Leaf326 TaxID=1736338 RepID=UPI0007003102|nr:hypothetical protein [Deinococcus sp. Leaf326]KQR37776.1 hypothetical protein ASF71_14945 [Deinococcus sp. Leaf326]